MRLMLLLSKAAETAAATPGAGDVDTSAPDSDIMGTFQQFFFSSFCLSFGLSSKSRFQANP